MIKARVTLAGTQRDSHVPDEVVGNHDRAYMIAQIVQAWWRAGGYTDTYRGRPSDRGAWLDQTTFEGAVDNGHTDMKLELIGLTGPW